MSEDNHQRAAKSSKKARATAARLAAVQAVYQMQENDQDARSVIPEYIKYRLGEPVDGEDMVLPDGALFETIVTAAETRRDDIETLVSSALTKQGAAKQDGGRRRSSLY